MKKLIKKSACLLTALLVPLSFAFAACNSGQPADNANEITGGENLPDGGQEGNELENNGGIGGEERAAFTEFTVEKVGADISYNIYCRMYLPDTADGSELLPAVILSHSAALTADSMNLYALGFAERGYAAITFDFCGGSSSSRSDGAEEDMTIFTEIEDLKTVFAYTKSLEYIDGGNIYLFGTGQGGFVSALTAAEIPDEVAGLILLYPAFNIPELAQKSSTGSLGLGGFDFSSIDFSSINFGSLIQDGFDFSFPHNGEDYIDTLKDFDAYKNIENYKGKVLILHGSKDFIVNSSYSERAAEVYGENCTLHIIAGAGHGFNSENYGSFFGICDDEVWEWIDGFLEIE